MRIIRPSQVPREVQHQRLFIGESAMQPLLEKGVSRSFWSCLRHWAPGARAKFHTHSSDQILIVTEGRGIVTTEKETSTVGIGDFVLIPAEEKHWHGATSDSAFAYIQIQTQDSKTVQLED